jgi:hypothetical protein
MVSITSHIGINSPDSNALLSANLAAEIGVLPIPAINAPTSFQGCSTFLPAPWLVSAILSAGTNKPLNLIVMGKEVANLFNQLHSGDQLYTTPAMDHQKVYAEWAWGVHQAKIPPMRFSLDPDDKDFNLQNSPNPSMRRRRRHRQPRRPQRFPPSHRSRLWPRHHQPLRPRQQRRPR